MRSVILDSLRGIAILLVLFRHYHYSYLMNQIGWIGVDLFFVLSGFLVSGLLFKEYQSKNSIEPIRFLIRRGFKIYPTFYFFLLLTVVGYFVLKVLGREHSLELHKLVYEALFIQNYVPASWGHTWSLAVEEHFYILLTLIVFLLVKAGRLTNQRFIILITLIVLGLVLVFRIITWRLNTDFTFHTHMYPTHLRIDSLLAGVLISYVFHFNPTVFYNLASSYWKVALIAALAILSTPFVWSIDSPGMGTIGLTMLYLAFGIVLWICIAFESVILSSRAVRYLMKGVAYIGFYSYSIYVFHTMIAAFLMPIILNFTGLVNSKILFLLYLLFSLSAGIFFAKLIELPFLKLRERFFPKLGTNTFSNG